MMLNERPVLSVKNLTVRYGAGCPSCTVGARIARPHVTDNEQQAHIASSNVDDTLTNVYKTLENVCDPHTNVYSTRPLEKNRCTVCKTVWALGGVSLDVYPGEVLGIVGESGSGKTTLMRTLYFDFTPNEGSALLRDYKDGVKNIWEASAAEQRMIKNNIMGMVYQNPQLGLRMDYSAASNIAEKIIAAGSRNASQMTERATELLHAVEIMTSRMKEAPQNFSGGMQQRVQISKALANNPALLLLDEVTTGLDLSVQAKVLDLIRKIKARYGISILLVSHDLAVIRMLADRTIVMLDGKIVESGLTDQILEDPQHAYTQQLVHSLI
jgi:putative phosphonate transport system ATP-binding protein